MIAPLSKSATTQASAEISPGTGGVAGAVSTPQPPSALPPIGDAGTGSGRGGSPACGTSDESTAGGVATLYGQASCPAPVTAGSASAAGMPSAASAATMKAAATRHDTVRK